MKLKGDANFKEKLTHELKSHGLKNVINNLVYFHTKI